jgi:cbb3-type cytochrome oxidase maturation protein
MDILFLLIPLSVVLVLLILGVFGWALHSGQLESLDREGQRILEEDWVGVDGDQAGAAPSREESRRQTI